MTPPTPTNFNFSDTNPAAPTGRMLAHWLASTAYGILVNINGVDETLQFRDFSASLPNFGGTDPRTTTTETIGLASQGKLVTISNVSAIAVTLNSAGVAAGFVCAIKIIGAGLATLTPSSGTIDTLASLQMSVRQGTWLFFDGVNWITSGIVGGQLTVIFSIFIGATGSNVGNMSSAPHAGRINKCTFVTYVSDPSVDFTFSIHQWRAGVDLGDIFASDPTIAHGTATGTVSTFTGFNTTPTKVQPDDVFSVSISSGTSAWKGTIELF